MKSKTFKDYINELKAVNEQVAMAEELLKGAKEKKYKLQDEAIVAMNEMGVKRAEDGNYQLILTKKKTYKVANILLFASEFNTRKVPQASYMKQDTMAMMRIANEWMKKGEEVKGLVEESKEYLTLKEKV